MPLLCRYKNASKEFHALCMVNAERLFFQRRLVDLVSLLRLCSVFAPSLLRLRSAFAPLSFRFRSAFAPPLLRFCSAFVPLLLRLRFAFAPSSLRLRFAFAPLMSFVFLCFDHTCFSWSFTGREFRSALLSDNLLSLVKYYIFLCGQSYFEGFFCRGGSLLLTGFMLRRGIDKRADPRFFGFVLLELPHFYLPPR